MQNLQFNSTTRNQCNIKKTSANSSINSYNFWVITFWIEFVLQSSSAREIYSKILPVRELKSLRTTDIYNVAALKLVTQA